MWSSLRTSGIGYSQLCQNLKNMKIWKNIFFVTVFYQNLFTFMFYTVNLKTTGVSHWVRAFSINTRFPTRHEHLSQNSPQKMRTHLKYLHFYINVEISPSSRSMDFLIILLKKHLKNLQILRLNATTGMFPEETSKFPPVVKPIHDLLVTARVLDFHECDIHWGAVVHVHQYKHSYYDVSLPRILDDLGNLTLLEQYQCSGLPVWTNSDIQNTCCRALSLSLCAADFLAARHCFKYVHTLGIFIYKREKLGSLYLVNNLKKCNSYKYAVCVQAYVSQYV